MKLVKSSKTGLYAVTFKTEYGDRTLSTGVSDKDEAKAIVRQAKVRELELAARSVRLSRQVVSQILVGRRVTAAEVLAEWETWLGTHLSPTTAFHYRVNVNAWLRDAGLANTQVSAFSEKHVDDCINNPTCTDKAGSRLVRLASLRCFFKFCTMRQYILGDPTVGIRVKYHLLRHDQKEPTVRRPFTDDELAALLDHIESNKRETTEDITLTELRLIAQGKPADETRRLGGKFKALEERRDALLAKHQRMQFWQTATVIGRHTGLRLGDVCCLEWASLATPSKLIVWTDKTNARVELPIPPELTAILDDVPRANPNRCFPLEHGLYADLRSRSRLSVEFTRLCRRAGVDHGSYHSLRHTYITACHRAGLPMPHISGLVGHASEAMTKHYVQE